MKRPRHLVNALVSFIGMSTCCVIAGELLGDVMKDERNFPDVPEFIKPFAIVMFLGFAALESNKVRNRITRARRG